MRGFIYKIESDCGSVLYVGSTTLTLNKRFSLHKSAGATSIAKYLKKDNNYKFSKGCELIKAYDIVDREHLNAYEQLWINKFRNCVNKQFPLNLLKMQKRKEYGKLYRENNANKVKEGGKVYRENNIEKEKRRHKIYYDNNKYKLFAKIQCECGSISSKQHLTRHIKSKKHQSYLESKDNLIECLSFL